MSTPLEEYKRQANWDKRALQLLIMVMDNDKQPSDIEMDNWQMTFYYEGTDFTRVMYLPAYDKYLVSVQVCVRHGDYENPPEWDWQELPLVDKAEHAVALAIETTEREW